MIIRMVLALSLMALPAMATAGNGQNEVSNYRIKVTNITRGQSFTPLLVAAHTDDVQMFRLGRSASAGLEAMAEGGDTSVLLEELSTRPSDVGDVTHGEGLLGPGESATFSLRVNGRHNRVSIAGMLLPTNDTFVALNGVMLPRGHSRSRRYLALAYDAGTEANDQNCDNIPGPRCGGEPFSDPADGDEGYVYVSNGFHDLDSDDPQVLDEPVYDWRNPVAEIRIVKGKK